MLKYKVYAEKLIKQKFPKKYGHLKYFFKNCDESKK